MTGCALHGLAITYGCPGCSDVVDDLVLAEQIRERMRNDTGERFTLDDLAVEFGIDLDKLRRTCGVHQPHDPHVWWRWFRRKRCPGWGK